MNVFFQKAFRIYIIILAFVFALILVYYFIKPKILKPLGFVDTNNCLKIIYKTIGNSCLIYLDPLNKWLWYNDSKVYIYGDSPDTYCENPEDYQPVYTLNMSENAEYMGAPLGYQCIKKLTKVKKIYDDNKAKWNVTMKCFKEVKNLTVQEIINILLKKRIIFNK